MRVNGRTNLPTPWPFLSRSSISLWWNGQKDGFGTSQCQELGTLFEKKKICQPTRGLHLPAQSTSCLQVVRFTSPKLPLHPLIPSTISGF
jgi:hypothetical protein